MSQIAPKHPITQALEIIAPIVGCNFVIRSPRDPEFQSYEAFPALDYYIVDEQNAVYDKSKNSWRITQLVRLDYHVQESINVCISDMEDLKHVQDIQAAMFAFSSKLKSIVTLMINPKSIMPTAIKDSDVIYNKYQFKLENFVLGVYHRKKGENKLTGASNIFSISFLDADKQFCCIDDSQKLRGLVEEGSISDQLIQNLAP